MTNIKSKLFLPLILSFVLSFTFISCNKDDEDTAGSGTTELKVTDAPFDDASVTAAVVTIADIKLDGVSVQGFQKTTVDLAAYQNGLTKTLGNFNIDGKTYSNITFVLDYDMDASGNAPGSYVVTTGGIKHKLQSSGNVVTVSKNFTLQSDAHNSLVADFDLRKMIIHQSGDPADQYDLATTAELQSSIRIVAENNAGSIAGILTDFVSASDKVIVYAYKKGTYDRTTEMQPQGTSGIRFKNSVSSSLVSNRGSYELHFLESGDYELHFASYKDINADGEFDLVGTLVVTTPNDIDLLNLSLGLQATLSVSPTVTGILP